MNPVKSAMKRLLDMAIQLLLLVRRHCVGIEMPKDTAMGFKLSGNPLMETGVFEPEETKIVGEILDKVDVVINVGANIGYYCCHALLKNKQVVAFEPLHSNLQFLYRNMVANRWQDKIEIFPVALSSKPGILEMFGGGTGASLVKGWAGAREDRAELVPVTTLDTALGNRFAGKKCFLLIDIEGAEFGMLEGALGFLSMTPKPIWLVEISVSEHQPKGLTINPNLLATFNVFWKYGYEAWTANSDSRLVEFDEIERIVRTNEDTLQTHNFLFVEKGCKGEYVAA